MDNLCEKWVETDGEACSKCDDFYVPYPGMSKVCRKQEIHADVILSIWVNDACADINCHCTHWEITPEIFDKIKQIIVGVLGSPNEETFGNE